MRFPFSIAFADGSSVIPFDPALDEGEEIAYEALNAKTKEAYMQAAALIIDGL